MTASNSLRTEPAPRTGGGRRVSGTRVLGIALAVLAALALAGVGVLRWLTAPGKLPATEAELAIVPEPIPPAGSSPPAPRPGLAWPDQTLSGAAAKQLLLEILQTAAERLERMPGYTATFHKQERIDGKLGPDQSIEMKLRQHPFSIYLKFLEPEPGKEVVYSEGRFDNKVIAHGGGLARRLLPRLALAPSSPLALAENRHPITDAGLWNLTTTLIHYRRLDLSDPDAVTILDRTEDHRGKLLGRSVHTHPDRNSERPFARVEVLYDPETFLPVEITSFDWPQPGHSDDLPLAEHYIYDNFQTTTSLTDIDFDPANPEHAFRRY